MALPEDIQSRIELYADGIAHGNGGNQHGPGGHGYRSHVLGWEGAKYNRPPGSETPFVSEFNNPAKGDPLNIHSIEDYRNHIKRVLSDAKTRGFMVMGGKTGNEAAFCLYNREANTIVFINETNKFHDLGTSYRPDSFDVQFENKIKAHQAKCNAGNSLLVVDGGLAGLVRAHPEITSRIDKAAASLSRLRAQEPVAEGAQKAKTSPLNDLRGRINNLDKQFAEIQRNTDPSCGSRMRQMQVELERISDSLYDAQNADHAIVKAVEHETARVHELNRQVNEYHDNFLRSAINALPPEHKMQLGLGERVAGAPDYTVHLGNHRTGAVLVLYQQGKIPGDSIVGSMRHVDGRTLPLTAAQLDDAFKESRLHTSNMDSRGRPWVDSGKIEGIVGNFDLKKFFDPGRDGGAGIVLRELPENHGMARYADAVDHRHEAPLSHYLHEKMHDTMETHAKTSGLRSRIGSHAGKATGVAGVAVAIAQGDMIGAGVGAAMEATQSEAAVKLAGKVAEGAAEAGAKSGLKVLSGLGKGLGFFAKRIPVVGAVVTSGFVLYEAGKNAINGDMGKAGAALAAGAAEVAGNVVGFGVGDAAREAVRGGIIAAAGEEYAADKSGLRSLGESAYELVSSPSRLDEIKGMPKKEFNVASAQPSAPSGALAPRQPSYDGFSA